MPLRDTDLVCTPARNGVSKLRAGVPASLYHLETMKIVEGLPGLDI